ncbi:hypothetical protein [Halalkalibacter urbisdiaboli]|uniref:hypothetical protein n=1 Tax=Halalkalibacter urbisdiaboli TaxID=1960589 RepID=UPI000B42EC4B|nr:hypothetical protein [Halalkalibacter urbisdiaboli]
MYDLLPLIWIDSFFDPLSHLLNHLLQALYILSVEIVSFLVDRFDFPVSNFTQVLIVAILFGIGIKEELIKQVVVMLPLFVPIMVQALVYKLTVVLHFLGGCPKKTFWDSSFFIKSQKMWLFS